ncbi:MAG: NUDIX hydrolase [Bacilli bacterium]|nr:NUDIX hydrolase [Bacilli bacterium]
MDELLNNIDKNFENNINKQIEDKINKEFIETINKEINSDIKEKISNDIESIKVIDYKEEDVYSDTSFIALKKGYYKLNNGHTIMRESALKKKGIGNASCIFAVTTDKKIIIVIQPRAALPTTDKVNIELPAGYIEENEKSTVAALRELEEETGYTSDNITLVDSYFTSLGFNGERIDLLLALDCTKIGEQHLDEDEFIHYELVSLEEFEYLLNNGYIMDANARIGYYRYLEYLMKEGY